MDRELKWGLSERSTSYNKIFTLWACSRVCLPNRLTGLTPLEGMAPLVRFERHRKTGTLCEMLFTTCQDIHLSVLSMEKGPLLEEALV